MSVDIAWRITGVVLLFPLRWCGKNGKIRLGSEMCTAEP